MRGARLYFPRGRSALTSKPLPRRQPPRARVRDHRPDMVEISRPPRPGLRPRPRFPRRPPLRPGNPPAGIRRAARAEGASAAAATAVWQRQAAVDSRATRSLDFARRRSLSAQRLRPGLGIRAADRQVWAEGTLPDPPARNSSGGMMFQENERAPRPQRSTVAGKAGRQVGAHQRRPVPAAPGRERRTKHRPRVPPLPFDIRALALGHPFEELVTGRKNPPHSASGVHPRLFSRQGSPAKDCCPSIRQAAGGGGGGGGGGQRTLGPASSAPPGDETLPRGNVGAGQGPGGLPPMASSSDSLVIHPPASLRPWPWAARIPHLVRTAEPMTTKA